jgi:hypothetical protein
MTEPSGIRLQPMLHVDALAPNIAFLELLGATLCYGSRDGDWALLKIGEAELALLAHPPNPADGDERLELNFVSATPLEEIEVRLRAQGVEIRQGTSDESFGRQLTVRTPDGLLVKINEIDRTLVE